MNASSKEILAQICKSGACPHTSARPAAASPPFTIGQIALPRGRTEAVAPAATPSPSDI